MDMGGEGGHEDPATGALEALAERGPDLELRARVTGAIDVRRVGAEREHAVLAELGKPSVVGRLTVERARVELEVAGVDDRTDRRVDGEPYAVGDRVRHPDRLDAERSGFDAVVRPHRSQIGAVEQIVLPQLFGDEGERERRAVHGN